MYIVSNKVLLTNDYYCIRSPHYIAYISMLGRCINYSQSTRSLHHSLIGLIMRGDIYHCLPSHIALLVIYWVITSPPFNQVIASIARKLIPRGLHAIKMKIMR